MRDEDAPPMKRTTTTTLLKACLFFFALTSYLFLSGCGGGNANLPTYDVAGDWFLYHVTPTTPGAQGPDLFVFTTKESSLAGTTPEGSSITGSVNGVFISFSWVDLDGTTNTYFGSVGLNGTMSGTWADSRGEKGTWNGLYDNATIVTAIVAGTWTISIDTPSAPVQGTFEFTQIGNNGLSGTTTLSLQTAVTGTLSNASDVVTNILFSWVDSDGVNTNVCMGTVAIGSATMLVTWTNTNGESGTWTGTKI